MLELDKIYNMDCLEGLDKVDDNSIDLIVSDPPYYLPTQTYCPTRKQNRYTRTLSDTSIFKTYFEMIFKKLDRVLKDTGSFYVFCDAQSYPIFYQVMFPLCKHVRLLVWDKLVSYNGYTWRHQHELIAWGEREKSKPIPTGDGDVIKCRGVLQKDRKHLAEKPIAILEKIISKHVKKDLVVCDPYIGSGSTALACKNIGVNFIGFEIDENYYNISLQRLLNQSRRLDSFIQMNNPLNTIVQSDEQVYKKNKGGK